jgi:acetate kinase
MILVLNAGSSTLKATLFAMDTPTEPAPRWDALSTWNDGDDREEAIVATLETLPHALRMIERVGHRVVHGGPRFQETVRVDTVVMDALLALAPLAPAHNPAAVAGMRAVRRVLGARLPQYAVFDTAFHRTLPDVAAIYPGPYAWTERGIRRYGFHGISHASCAERAAALLGRPLGALRLITCHLGSGCSLAAIRDGHSVDTTMGLTPLDGLMMGTRSGAVDPGILLYLLRNDGIGADELERVLTQESGLKGISGISGDLREVQAAADRGEGRAALALEIFVHRLRAGIAAQRASLDRLDALVFTGGIGEHSAPVREAVCAGLEFLGVRLDPERNADGAPDRAIDHATSAVKILVIAAQENAAIAREVFRQGG